MTESLRTLYSSAVTFGRFNIPHHGHVQLIHKMLQYAEIAYVYVSEGINNNEWDLRVLALKHLCRQSNLELSKIHFCRAIKPHTAVSQAIKNSPYKETLLVMGSDQEETAKRISQDFDVPYKINNRVFSSTEVRNAIALYGPWSEEVLKVYNQDAYSVRLALILREEEKFRSKSF